MTILSYRTLSARTEAEIVVSRSRFRCTLAPVPDEAAARAVVDALRKEHWDARHTCSAFVLGPARAVARSSDDGEPSGTAGAPMLEVLRGRELTDVVAVVTRWFGGLLLGTGGLARAYGDAVRAAAEDAPVIECHLRRLVDVDVDVATAGRLEHTLRSRGIEVLGVDYTDRARLRLAVDPGCDVEAIVAGLIGGNRLEVTQVGEGWF